MTAIYKPELVVDDFGNGVKEWLIKETGQLAFTEEEKKACKIRTYPNGLKITKWRDQKDPEHFSQTTFSNEQGKKDREIISLSEQGNTETKTTGRLREKIEEMQQAGILTFSQETQQALDSLKNQRTSALLKTLSNGSKTQTTQMAMIQKGQHT